MPDGWDVVSTAPAQGGQPPPAAGNEWDVVGTQSAASRYFTEPAQSALGPRPEQDAWDTAINAVKAAAAPLVNMVMHPIDTARSMGQQIVTSGVSPNGYPIFGPTGNAAADEANQRISQLQQSEALQSGNQMRQQTPGYYYGSLIGPVLLGEAVKLAPPVGEAVIRTSARGVNAAMENAPTAGALTGSTVGGLTGGYLGHESGWPGATGVLSTTGGVAGAALGFKLGKMIQNLPRVPGERFGLGPPVPESDVAIPAGLYKQISQAAPQLNDRQIRGIGQEVLNQQSNTIETMRAAAQARRQAQPATSPTPAPAPEAAAAPPEEPPTPTPAPAPAAAPAAAAGQRVAVSRPATFTDQLRQSLAETPEEAPTSAPAATVPLPRDLADALDDNILLQQLRSDMAHQASGVELEKERSRYMAELPSSGATRGMETAAASSAIRGEAPQKWTQLSNWSERDTQRVLSGDYSRPSALDLYVTDQQYESAVKRWQRK